jgi:hypothetical protein
MSTSRFWLPVFAILVTSSPALSEDKPEPGPWKFGTALGLTLAESAFSSNWAGGDRGSLVWTATTLSSADRQVSASFNWSNKLNLAYGQTSKQEPGTNASQLQWQSPEKTTDAIALESLGRWTLGAFVDPYVAFNGQSQFEDQSDPRGTIRLNPIKLRESAGAARVLYKTADSEGLTRLGFAFRQTLAKSFSDPQGLVKQSFTANDGGIEWQTDIKRPVLDKKVLYKSTLLVYQPVFYSESDDLETVDATLRSAFPGRESIADFWKTVDVSFQNDFFAEITKSIGVNLALQLVYDKFDSAALVDPALAASADPAVQTAYAAQIDKNVRKAGQFREVFSLALNYKLF